MLTQTQKDTIIAAVHMLVQRYLHLAGDQPDSEFTDRSRRNIEAKNVMRCAWKFSAGLLDGKDFLNLFSGLEFIHENKQLPFIISAENEVIPAHWITETQGVVYER